MMPTCPKCRSALDELKGKFVCSNEGCDFALSKAKFLQSYSSGVQHDFPQEPWFKKLCADETLWQKNVFEDYPCIVAHEYWRLYDLLDQGQTYGAFLQLKDVFEVLIKFPTLIAASILYGKRERSDEENKILIALLEKWLTLGTWEEIAKTMGKKISLPQNVAAIQNDIVRFFHEYSIREWRNKAIGHGALAFDADKEFQQDIQEKLLLLKTHFQDYAGTYAALCVFLRNHEQRVLLHGKEKARNLQYQTSEIRIQIGEAFEYSLAPYILLKNSGIYFFDSYIPHDHKTVILNYPEGDKQQVYNDDFTRLYTTLAMDHRLKQLSGSFANETYSTLEAETLDKIAAIDDFQKPVYLRIWLKELVDGQTKGVFLLQMERGMGKTTFVRALDQQTMSRIHLNDPDDFSVRSYYINSAYLYKVEHFSSKAGFLLLTDTNRKIAIQGNLPVLSGRSEHKPQDFAKLLNFYRREHQRHFRKARLLFIIDGLDEIPATDGASIFDFLPTPELLDDGVFLLLTCRTDPEISPFTRHHLNIVTFTDYLSVQKDDLRHIDVLRAYINNQIASMERQHAEILLKKAENRFLYLKTIKVLLKVSQYPEELVFSDGKALFIEFLDSLRHAYGEKFFTGVVKLLAILATAFEPLTVHEISYLAGEAQPTFKLLAHLIDLRGFLNAEHSYRGSVLEIAHPDLRQVMHEHYDHTIQALVQRWIEEHLPEDVQNIDIEEDGKIYLLTYMAEYVKTYTGKSYDSVFDAAFVEKLSMLALKLQRESQAEHHRERVIALYTALVEMQAQLVKTGALPDEQVFTKTFMNRGRAYLNIHRIEDAIADYDRVIAIRQTFLDTGKSEEKDRLAAALVNRGTAYLLLQNTERALSDYGQAIELRQDLQKQGTLQDESSLARIFVNRGNLYRRIHNIHAAIADFSHAVEIQQRCFERGILEHEHELAAALMNRGIAYMQIHNNQNALADYDRAIELFQQLRHSGRLTDETHIARALINRAILYGRKQQLSQAIADYSQAIESQEKLRHTGRLADENELARTYVNRGIVYKTKHQYQEAITDYQRAIEIQEHLLHEGKLRYEHELAWALTHRGEAYTQDQQIAQALADFERALLIQQELLQAGKFVDERELALTYLNRGIAFTKKGQFPEAISDFDYALTKQQELVQAGKLSDEDELAWTLLHRGIVYRENQQFTEALADFDHAIAIQQQLNASGKLLDEYDLVLAFLHRGTTHKTQQNVTAALDDMRTALDITRALLPARPFLLETYKQTLSSLMSILQEHGMTAAHLTNTVV